MSPKTIVLTEWIRQGGADGPLAWLVLCHESCSTHCEYKVFTEERAANDYAIDCEEKAGDGKPWPVYPLYAADPENQP